MRRNTKEREIVFSAIEILGHATTKQIIDSLEGKNVSLATIYRNLNILLEDNKIKKIRMSGTEEIYETVKEGHFHFRCHRCNRIIDIDKSMVKINVVNNSMLSNAEIGEHDIVLYGVCPNCKKIN